VLYFYPDINIHYLGWGVRQNLFLVQYSELIIDP